jgi:mono/diheme cytochrome c family protein
VMRRGLLVALALTVLRVTTACSSAEDASAPADKRDIPGYSSAREATPGMMERGREIYRTNCAACHGQEGKGDGPGAAVLTPPPGDHTDSAYMATLSDREIADVIKMGGAIKGRPLMPSHPHISGTDMDSLIAYIRSLAKKP